MARSNRIQQIYGYLVCLIAIVTLIIATANLVGSLFDLARPDNSDRFGRRSFSEFRSQRLMEDRGRRVSGDTSTSAVPPDSALRREYNEEMQQNRELAHWGALKSIVTNSLLIVLALILFTIHWRWSRSLERDEESNG